MSDSFRDAIISHIPALRAFALSLASRPEADDLVQETLTRAMQYSGSFESGTNLASWLRKILQNCFYNDIRRKRHTVEDVEGRCAAQQSVAASQEWSVRCGEMLAAVNRLPADSRNALLMIVAQGMSYEEAAKASDCAIGTVKSRVNRARERLIEMTEFSSKSPSGSVSTPPFQETFG